MRNTLARQSLQGFQNAYKMLFNEEMESVLGGEKYVGLVKVKKVLAPEAKALLGHDREFWMDATLGETDLLAPGDADASIKDVQKWYEMEFIVGDFAGASTTAESFKGGQTRTGRQALSEAAAKKTGKKKPQGKAPLPEKAPTSKKPAGKTGKARSRD